jgi:putative RecB family exonuclease
MWIIKDNRIQDNSARSCNNREAIGASQKNPGFSRGNLYDCLFPCGDLLSFEETQKGGWMALSYSNSKIGTFENCPRHYKFQYIEKAAVEKPVSVEQYLGDAVHRALEKIYQYKLNGRVPTEDEIMEFYRQHWERPERDNIKVTREYLGIDDYIKTGAEALHRYYEMHHPFDDGSSLGLEKIFSFPLDEAGRFSIRGKIDRISLLPDGTIEIIDYKTSAGLPTQRALNDDDQMGLYNLAVRYLWPDFKNIRARQIFLRHGISLEIAMTEEKLEEIRYRTIQRILQIEQAKDADNFPPKESALCDWCVYYELCPAKRHRLALDDEITVEFDKEMGRDLAEKYLQLDRDIKKIKSEQDALKDDIFKFCEQVDVTSLSGANGRLMVSMKEQVYFPCKTEDENGYMD